MIKRLFTPLHFIVSLVGNLFVAVLFGLALLPAYFLVQYTWSHHAQDPTNFWSALWICLALGLSFFISGYSLLVMVILARFILRLNNREVTGEFKSLPVPLLRNAAYNLLVNAVQQTFLPFVRGTPLLIWFYRSIGAKIGEGTLITTVRIMDCDLVEIGKSCVIGGGVAISAHTGEKSRGVLKKVKIGDRVTIGADTIVLPGAVIEDNVIVGANSLVPKDSHLEANSIYGGVPVRKLR